MCVLNERIRNYDPVSWHSMSQGLKCKDTGGSGSKCCLEAVLPRLKSTDVIVAPIDDIVQVRSESLGRMLCHYILIFDNYLPPGSTPS